jgi:hypothetical protein
MLLISSSLIVYGCSWGIMIWLEYQSGFVSVLLSLSFRMIHPLLFFNRFPNNPRRRTAFFKVFWIAFILCAFQAHVFIWNKSTSRCPNLALFTLENFLKRICDHLRQRQFVHHQTFPCLDWFSLLCSRSTPAFSCRIHYRFENLLKRVQLCPAIFVLTLYETFHVLLGRLLWN